MNELRDLSRLINLSNIYCAPYGDKETSKTRISSSETGRAGAKCAPVQEAGLTPLVGYSAEKAVGLALKRCEFC